MPLQNVIPLKVGVFVIIVEDSIVITKAGHFKISVGPHVLDLYVLFRALLFVFQCFSLFFQVIFCPPMNYFARASKP